MFSGSCGCATGGCGLGDACAGAGGDAGVCGAGGCWAAANEPHTNTHNDIRQILPFSFTIPSFPSARLALRANLEDKLPSGCGSTLSALQEWGWHTIAVIPLFLVRLAVRALIALFYRVRVRGEDNLPSQGGALLVSNHVSLMDGFLLGWAARRRHVR